MEDEPLAAGRDALGDPRQHLVRIDSQALRRFALGGCNFVADPAEDDATVVHRSADHPVAIGQRITERAARGIGRRPVEHRAHRAAGADGDRHLARLDCVDADVRERAVVGADNERRCCVDAQLGRHARAQTLEMVGRGHELRQPLAAHARDLERALVPVERREIEEPGRRCDRMVDDIAAEQAMKHVLLDADEARGGCEKLRLLVAQPGELHERRHRMDGRTGTAIDRHPVAFRANPLRPAGGAIVRPGDAARQRGPIGGDRDDAVHRGAECDAREAVGRNARGANRIANRGDDRAMDLVGILFGGGRRRRQQRVLDGAVRDDTPAQVEDDGLGRRRADVDADHMVGQTASPGRMPPTRP